MILKGPVPQAEAKVQDSDVRIESIVQAFTVTGDYVLCISTVQFSDQSFEDVIDRLLRLINSYHVTEENLDPENICNES